MLTCLYNGQKIYVEDCLASLPLRDLGRRGELLCPDPECRRPVILHQGKYKRPHFAHKKGTGNNCQFGVSESPEHVEGKRFICDLLRSIYSPDQVKLEEFLESGQKVDVLLDLGRQKYAFEIQFSEQDGCTWEERNQKFRAIGIVPIWILGYRKPLSEIVEDQGLREPAKVRLGRAREAAVKKVSIVYELEYRLTKEVLYSQAAWENVYKYSVVHFLSIFNGDPVFYLAYINQKSPAIWEGYTSPIDKTSFFDQTNSRFVPAEEVSANRRAEIAFQEWSNWKSRINTIQEDLRQKVLSYTKVKSIERLPVILENWDIFHEYSGDRDYDILLLEAALYLKIIRLRHFSEDVIEEMFRSWKFEWKEYRNLFLWGEIGEFIKRLVKAGVLDYDEMGVWKVKGKLPQ